MFICKKKQGVLPKYPIKEAEKFNLQGSIHHFEKLEEQVGTVLAILKTFQVFPIQQVVKNIEEDNAGSIFNFCKINGINIPDTPEIIKFATIAKKAIIPK